LLSLSRAQMGQQMELDRQPTDLVALARQVVKEQQQTTRRHQLAVETDLEELAGIWDAAHLERVIVNLLSNAIKYSPDGGEITIEIFQEDDAACLVVRDSGLGIPAKDLPHIFEQFQRGSNVSGKIKGTGIGLSSVQQIVERHGGTINVVSEADKGSTFTVYLPLTTIEE
jgi:signal transduction histidine kinase